MKRLLFTLLILGILASAAAFQNRKPVRSLESETMPPRYVAKPAREDSPEPKTSTAVAETRQLHSIFKMNEASMEAVLASATSCERGPAAIERARESHRTACMAEKAGYGSGELKKADLASILQSERNEKISRGREIRAQYDRARQELDELQTRRHNLEQSVQATGGRVSAEESLRALDRIIEQARRQVEALDRARENNEDFIRILDERTAKLTDQKRLYRKLTELCDAQIYFYDTWFDVLKARLALECPDDDDPVVYDHPLPKLIRNENPRNSQPNPTPIP
jgi:hypothetical protein